MTIENEQAPEQAQEKKELTAEEMKQISNVRVLQAYQVNVALVDQLTLQMSSRQIARVMRSLMRAPFQDAEKFIDRKEKMLFDAGMQIMDAKMLLMMEQSGEIAKELEATRKVALELELKEKGE